MSSNPPHRLDLDVDPDEGLTTSHLASSLLSAAEVDAEPAYAHDDVDHQHQAASTVQPQALSATTSLHQSAAKCKNVGVDDADPMESSANSSDDVIVDPNRGETDHEDDARLDAIRQ